METPQHFSLLQLVSTNSMWHGGPLVAWFTRLIHVGAAISRTLAGVVSTGCEHGGLEKLQDSPYTGIYHLLSDWLCSHRNSSVWDLNAWLFSEMKLTMGFPTCVIN